MKDRFCKRGLAATAHVSRSFAKHDVGASAAIEFAVVAPLLIVLMIASVDLGMGFYRKMQVQSAAQAGAVYAMLHGFSSSSVTSAVTSATTLSGLSASPAPSQFCGCPSTSGITTTACTSTCSDASKPRTYVSVSAQASYRTIMSYPLVPSSFTLTDQSTVRIQ